MLFIVRHAVHLSVASDDWYYMCLQAAVAADSIVNDGAINGGEAEENVGITNGGEAGSAAATTL